MSNKRYFNPRLKRFNKLKDAARSSKIQLPTRLNKRGLVRHHGGHKEVPVLYPRRRAS